MCTCRSFPMISHDVEHQLSEFGEPRSEQMMSELQAVFVGPFISHQRLDTMYLKSTKTVWRCLSHHLSATSRVEIGLWWHLAKIAWKRKHMMSSCFHECFFFPGWTPLSPKHSYGSAILPIFLCRVLCQRWTQQQWISSIQSPCFGVALYFCKAASFWNVSLQCANVLFQLPNGRTGWAG